MQNQDNRESVTDGYLVPDILSLNRSGTPSDTNLFYIMKSKGNKKDSSYVTVSVVPGIFVENKNSLDTEIFPTAIIADSTVIDINSNEISEEFGPNKNGVSFKYMISSGVFMDPEDIGSFYISFDSKDFEKYNIVAGGYQSTISILITDET